MGKTININILKGLDKKESEQVKAAFNFVCSQLKLETKVSLVSEYTIDSDNNEFLIVHVDEITLDQMKNQSKANDFFLSQSFDKTHILLILEDISIDMLPDYLHYFPAFELKHDFELSNEHAKASQTSLIQVVHDIVLFIKEAKKLEKSGLTIFIGPSDDTTTIEYQKIIRELLHRNHHIIPKILNPTAKELIENPQLINTILSDADLCIHFIGHKSISDYPEKVSPAMKVNEIVANYCKQNNNIQRILYVPDEDDGTAENVRLKILQFKSNMEALQNAELVQTPVEKFKQIVLTKIQEIILPLAENHNIKDESEELYLIYAPGFESEVESIRKWLNENNFKYAVSQVELDQLDLINYHKNKLKNCSGVLIYSYGNRAWLSRKLSDILKAPGWGRKTAYKYKIVLGSGIEETEGMEQLLHSVKYLNVKDKEAFKELKTIIQN